VEVGEQGFTALREELDRDAKGRILERRYRGLSRLLLRVEELNLNFRILLRIFHSSTNHDGVDPALSVRQRSAHR
jgi:hypothetical protein